MSALRIEKLKDPGLSCINGCMGQHGTRRPAPYAAYIAGRHAGDLCRRCSVEWQKVWDGAQTTLRIRVDPFDGIYLLRNPEVVESAMFGPMLQGRFSMESDREPVYEDVGAFRMDRLSLCEPVEGEQMTLNAAVAA